MKPLQKSNALFSKAREVIPGGVNSPVRAFKAVGLDPRFIAKAAGSHIWDADGNEYLDFVGSWGPMILGHAHPAVVNAVIETSKNGLSFGAPCEKEVELASLITECVSSVQMVRMVSSGTEAVMSALRVARAFTGKSKILKFEGCYHGHSDALLVKAGSGALTGGVPDSAGVPAEFASLTLTGQYNDLLGTRAILEKHAHELAAVIVEPVAANMGVVAPQTQYLNGLRELCTQFGVLLIFDEVITGFRMGLAGAQGRYNVMPDLTIFGKIIGGGMPVGAYGGRKDIMELVAPIGPVYQAGTLSGNPVAMAAGLATIRQIKTTLQFYEKLELKAQRFADGLESIAKEYSIPLRVNRVGSLITPFFNDGSAVESFSSVMKSDRERFATFFRAMLERGFYLAPSQFEALFISASHSDSEIDRTLEATRSVFKGS